MSEVRNAEIRNTAKWYQKLDWSVTLFLIITPIVVLISLPIYIYYFSLPLGIVSFSLVYAALTNLSITAGYHRLFSHKSYEAHWFAKLLFLLVGASAFQGSALKWSSDHRRHHSFEDTDKDPYNIHRGFWYAHMGWLFLKESVDQPIRAQDLQNDPLVFWQHRYFIPLSIFMGFVLPTLVGYFLGSAWGGFILAGALRVVLTQQSTFFVNSLSHMMGRRPYSMDVTARDSLIVAFLTHGEGYHNFHHKFQLDYRNGIRWYQWDPTKWTIQTLRCFGLAGRLKKISSFEILKARILTEARRLQEGGWSIDKIESMKAQLMENMAKYRNLKEDYERRRREMARASRDRLAEIKIEMRAAHLEFKRSLKQWRSLAKAPIAI